MCFQLEGLVSSTRRACRRCATSARVTSAAKRADAVQPAAAATATVFCRPAALWRPRWPPWWWPRPPSGWPGSDRETRESAKDPDCCDQCVLRVVKMEKNSQAIGENELFERESDPCKDFEQLETNYKWYFNCISEIFFDLITHSGSSHCALNLPSYLFYSFQSDTSEAFL